MALEKPLNGLEIKFEELGNSIARELGLELYESDYIAGSKTWRLFIQNPESQSANLDDCANVDRALTPFIEELEWMPDQLTLEVSSPGIFRTLKRLKHFEMAVGQRVAISLKNPLTDSGPLRSERKVIGELVSVNDQNLILRLEGQDWNINFEQIKKANVEPLLASSKGMGA